MFKWLTGAALKSFFSALFEAIRDHLRQIKQRREDRQAGANEAARETAETTNEIADKRAEVASGPDDPDTVADWLRDEANRTEGGGTATVNRYGGQGGGNK